jgi:urease accessory protein
MALFFTHKLDHIVPAQLTISLTAHERDRSRLYIESENHPPIHLQLPRGTKLYNGDLLQASSGEIAQIIAKPEPVLVVTARNPLDLLKAAYHLGNRHVPLEITPTSLKLAADPVLQHMLEHLGLEIQPTLQPFQPETGAYDHQH